MRRLQADLLAVSAHQRVLVGVERQVARDRKRGDQLRRCYKRVRGWVAVVACREVAVVRGDDRVGIACTFNEINKSGSEVTGIAAYAHASFQTGNEF